MQTKISHKTDYQRKFHFFLHVYEHTRKMRLFQFAVPLFCSAIAKTQGLDSAEIRLHPSGDTFVRRNRGDGYYGASSKITLTRRGANQRIGLIKFDSSQYNIKAKEAQATLKLSLAEIADTNVEVKAYRLVNDFDEDHLSWDTFDGDVYTDQSVTFTVHKDLIDSMHEVDISSLLRDGKDVMLALIAEDGHVKFHSKDSDHQLVPELVLRPSKK